MAASLCTYTNFKKLTITSNFNNYRFYLIIFLILLSLFLPITQQKPYKRRQCDTKKLEVVVTLDNPEDSCTTSRTTTTFCSDLLGLPKFAALDQSSSKETILCTEPGSYANPDNSNDFFICQRKDDDNTGMEKIELTCPKGMVFDKDIKKCRRKATQMIKYS